MTEQEIQERNGKSLKLSVFQITEGQYIVESSKGKICYKVLSQNGSKQCSCADFTSNIQKNQTFLCKHILAVMNCNGDAVKIGQISKEKPKLDDRFITNIKGKDFVIYNGVLDMAHQLGIKKLCVKAVQYPNNENGMEAICIANLITPNGCEYEEIGDANPRNVTSMVREHIIRVAATRAKARILRDYTNIGMTCLEELGNIDNESDAKTSSGKKISGSKISGKSQTPYKPVQETQAKEEPVKQNNEPVKQADNQETKPEVKQSKPEVKQNKPDVKEEPKTERITPAQINAISNIAKRRGLTDEDVEKKAAEVFNKELKLLSAKEASTLIRELQQSS